MNTIKLYRGIIQGVSTSSGVCILPLHSRANSSNIFLGSILSQIIVYRIYKLVLIRGKKHKKKEKTKKKKKKKKCQKRTCGECKTKMQGR